MRSFRFDRLSGAILALFLATGAVRAVEWTLPYAIPAGGVDVSDELTLTGTGDLTGGTLTLADGAKLRVASGAASVKTTVVAGTDAAKTVTLQIDDGASLYLTASGVLSGAAKISVTGAGDLYLQGANDFTGEFSTKDVHVYVQNEQAFGSADAKTSINCSISGGICRFDGGTFAEPFFFASGTSWQLRFDADTTTTFNGPVTVDGYFRMQPIGGSTVTFAGGLTNKYQVAFYHDTGTTLLSTIRFNNRPLSCPNLGSTLYNNKQHVFEFNVASNTIGYIQGEGGLTVRTTVDYAFDNPDMGLWARNRRNTDGFVLDLCGTVQRIGTTTNVEESGAISVTSVSAATLRWEQKDDTGVNLTTFAGMASLCKEGAGTLTLAATSTTTGRLEVAAGRLVLSAPNGRWINCTNVFCNGGTLACSSSEQFSQSGGLVVKIANGGHLELLDSVDLAAAELWLDGTRQPDGTYEAAKDTAHFAGNGRIIVGDASQFADTWTGDDAAPDVTRNDNWKSGTAPDLEEGAKTFTFAESGTWARIANPFSVGGIVFDAVGDFLVAGTDAGVLKVGSGGITCAAPASGTRTYDLRLPVNLDKNQSWTLGAGVTLVATNLGVSSASGVIFTKSGEGDVDFSGDNAFSGSVIIRGGGVKSLFRIPLDYDGDGADYTFVNDTGKSDSLTLLGGRFKKSVIFEGYNVYIYPRLARNATNIFEGPVSFGSKNFRPHYDNDSLTVFAGGATHVASYHSSQINEGAAIVFTNVASSLANYSLINYSSGRDNPSCLIWAVPGNQFGTGFMGISGNISCKTTVPHALDSEDAELLLSWYGAHSSPVLDLCGGDQRMGSLVYRSYGYDMTDDSWKEQAYLPEVTSATPATLYVKQASSRRIAVCFTGMAGLSKYGSATLTFVAQSATTGTLAVTEGTVAFETTAAWSNVTQVAVSGSGCLSLAADNQLGRGADLFLSDTGTLSLPEETVTTVSRLYLPEVSPKAQASGLWGAPDNVNAPNRTARLSGKGLLYVRKSDSGITLIFR